MMCRQIPKDKSGVALQTAVHLHQFHRQRDRLCSYKHERLTRANPQRNRDGATKRKRERKIWHKTPVSVRATAAAAAARCTCQRRHVCLFARSSGRFGRLCSDGGWLWSLVVGAGVSLCRGSVDRTTAQHTNSVCVIIDAKSFSFQVKRIGRSWASHLVILLVAFPFTNMPAREKCPMDRCSFREVNLRNLWR